MIINLFNWISLAIQYLVWDYISIGKLNSARVQVKKLIKLSENKSD